MKTDFHPWIFFGWVFLLLSIGGNKAQCEDSIPSGVDDQNVIVTRLEVRAAERARALGTYRSSRIYRVINDQRNFRRDYPISMEVTWPDSKRYELPDPPPNGVVFRMAIKNLLDTEVANAGLGIQKVSAITSANYQFQLEGREEIDGESCWRLRLTPQRKSRFLIQGQAWVSCTDYEIVKLEGRPSKMPSFWIKDIRLIRLFQKVGDYWLPHADRSINQIRVFGETQLEIDYLDYEFGAKETQLSTTPKTTLIRSCTCEHTHNKEDVTPRLSSTRRLWDSRGQENPCAALFCCSLKILQLSR